MGNSPARSSVDVGSVIAGTYTIEALIGRGGMGAVFLASHNRLPGKKVAIKLLHAELTDAEVVARFRREAMIASQLDHPNIVGVTDFNVTADGMPYLVLEYLQGDTLAQRLTRGPISLDDTLSIIRQIGSALAAAHREGIVHRDLKPQNIFLVQSELAGHSVEIAKVLDFGISKIRGSQTVKTQESTLLGTPQYMAPEQATGQHAIVDDRTDVFALGAIVYEMLSGEPAFSGASIPEVVFKVVYEPAVPLATRAPHVPPAIAAAVEQAMAKLPEQRFPSVRAFVEALTGVPLANLRPSSIGLPEVGFATGSRPPPGMPPHDTDPYAQTMGSQQPGAAQVSPPVGEAPAAPRRRSIARRLGLVVGFAACAAIAAAAMYFAMRRPEASQAGAIADVAVATAPPDAAAAVAVTNDAPVVAVVDAARAPAPPRETKVAPPKQVPDTDGGPEDDTARGQLQQANAALAQSEYDRAERLANTVINSDSAGVRQRAHAHTIHGIVECRARNNREGAQIDLRRIGNRPKFRRMLIDGCANAGIELR